MLLYGSLVWAFVLAQYDTAAVTVLDTSVSRERWGRGGEEGAWRGGEEGACHVHTPLLVCSEAVVFFSSSVAAAALPIPQGTCWLADELLTEDPSTKVFIHHRVVSYLLGFLDSTAYIRLRQCSKLLCRVIDMDLNKRLYRLPFQSYPEKTDIGYCEQSCPFFFSTRCTRRKERGCYPRRFVFLRDATLSVAFHVVVVDGKANLGVPLTRAPRELSHGGWRGRETKVKLWQCYLGKRGKERGGKTSRCISRL